MPFLNVRRVKDRIFPNPARLPAAGVRDLPQKIVLAPRAGSTPSDRPPVRIYLGTEAGQYRAERVFIHSVEKVRDPARTYEIHLMKDVCGYDRRWWLTGFTNYRFAIAEWAGPTGRAIYNDVDQVWLSDPAELFDSDMDGKGFLALSPDDTAVMLIDCERMRRVWTYEIVSRAPRREVEKRSRHEWGKLENCWHARDFDYVPGYSKCLHYTTIHQQPWRPFPAVLVYMPEPLAPIWHALEREADEAQYSSYDFTSGDTLYASFVSRVRSLRRCGTAAPLPIPPSPFAPADLNGLLALAEARSILDFSPARPCDDALESRVGTYPGATLTTFDPTATAAEGMDVPHGPFDVVLSTRGLELLSDEDIPWILDRLLQRARRAVVVFVDDIARSMILSDGTTHEIHERGFAWWSDQLAAASRGRPDVRWRLGVHRRTALGGRTTDWREGGRRLEQSAPRVWVLADPKPGRTTSIIGLLETLGWPWEIRDCGFPWWTRFTDGLLGPKALDPSGRRAEALCPPWPDLVISTGPATGAVARWVAARSGGRTSVIGLGHESGDVAAKFDLVATCSHRKHPPHERRIELQAPLHQVTPARLAEASKRFPDLFASHPSPRIVVLVGGNLAPYVLSEATARRLGEEVVEMARRNGGSVVVVTSPRTPAPVIAALESVMRRGDRPCGEVHRWGPGRLDNPYLAYLAGADALVVTGESESMIAEACATGKPVSIYPLPKKSRSFGQRVTDLVTSVAYSKPRKRKGTFRPQQGREYLCARLIERGIVPPSKDLEAFHRSLVNDGHARIFDGTLDLAATTALNEVEVVAARVRSLLGCPENDEIPAQPRQASGA